MEGITHVEANVKVWLRWGSGLAWNLNIVFWALVINAHRGTVLNWRDTGHCARTHPNEVLICKRKSTSQCTSAVMQTVWKSIRIRKCISLAKKQGKKISRGLESTGGGWKWNNCIDIYSVDHLVSRWLQRVKTPIAFPEWWTLWNAWSTIGLQTSIFQSRYGFYVCLF